MDPATTALAAAALAAWLFLLAGRDGFWRADQRLGRPPEPADWPAVAAVVPARDEAAVIDRSLGSLLAQDYPGRFAVVLVDDHSTDATGAIAARLAAGAPPGRLTVVPAADLPPGWAGKVWAQAQGIAAAQAMLPEARHLLLTDADIAHDPGTLRRLVAKAEAEGRDLVSLMALLSCRGPWERLLIPAFVFFFQKLYPFRAVNDPRRRTAGAAGGCMLVRADTLARIGGIGAIRGALIDDCALAAAVQGQGGRLWLGLTAAVRSIRPYDGLGGIWRMVARSAYTQLRHSPWRLAGTVPAMTLVYLVPPVLALGWPLHGDPVAAALALAAWLAMAAAYRPTLRLYEEPAPAALLLPAAALLYTAMTVDSAVRHWRGVGGRWKGRVQAPASEAQ